MHRNFGDAAATVRRAVGTAGNQVAQGVSTARLHVEQKVERGVEVARSIHAPWPQSGGSAASTARPSWCNTGPVEDLSNVLADPLELRICSWNLHGTPMDTADDVGAWLVPPDGVTADLLVIGTQELVELGARSVVMNASGDEQRQSMLEARIADALDETCGRGRFLKVCGFGMVGLSLLIYLRADLGPYLRDLDCDRVKTGLDGKTGNKGGLCARFQLGEITMCFVNVHLASGQHATAERSQHLMQIMKDAFQSTSSARGAARPPKFGFQRQSRYSAASHNLTVILGDFNSRLELPKEVTWPLGKQEAWLQKDQLLLGRASSALKGFREGLIRFPPTYKYEPGSRRLSSSRCPAWCDRVIFKADYGTEVELFEYTSFPQLCHTSDHRPVAAQLAVEVSPTSCGPSGVRFSGSPHAASSTATSTAFPAAGEVAAAANATFWGAAGPASHSHGERAKPDFAQAGHGVASGAPQAVWPRQADNPSVTRTKAKAVGPAWVGADAAWPTSLSPVSAGM